MRALPAVAQGRAAAGRRNQVQRLSERFNQG
jgi:hypothetical protein